MCVGFEYVYKIYKYTNLLEKVFYKALGYDYIHYTYYKYSTLESTLL